MLKGYGHLVYRFRVWLVALGLACMVGAGFYAGGVYHSLNQGGFEVAGAQSTTADRLINAHFGGNRDSLVVLFSSPSLTVDDPLYRQAALSRLHELARQKQVSDISSYFGSGSQRLVSSDRHQTYALIGLKGNEDARANAVPVLRALLVNPYLQVQLGGQAAVDAESTAYIKHDLTVAERYTFPVTAILLLLFFRSVLAAMLPLALGIYGVIGALVITRLVAYVTPMSEYVLNLISLLGLGLAIDYSLFIVSRFREELSRLDGNVELALGHTFATAGKTVVFSALTVMISLAGLVIFPIGFLRSMGVGGSAAVLVALLGSLLFLPALLAVLGKRVNMLRISQLFPHPIRAKARGEGNWRRLTQLVMRHSLPIVGVTLAVLLMVGIPFLHANFVNPDFRILPTKSEARLVGESLDSNFNGASQTPIEIVLKTPHGINGPDVYKYLHQLAAVPGVAHVAPLEANAGYTFIRVFPQASTYAAATKKTVSQLRDIPAPASEQWVGGRTADLVDLLNVVHHYSIYALIVVLAAMFVLFFFLLGSLVIPLKTIILNILSLSASYGVLVWVFQEGHLVHVVGATPMAGIDATQPVIIFALAFGLSMDYAIFLFSRVKEHFDEESDIRKAIAWGVQKTGGIITSAAMLLLVVICAFAAGRIVVMKEVAIGLIVAVLVDVFIVRLLLVPASMTLLGKHNWWAPPLLRRFHARFGLKEGG